METQGFDILNFISGFLTFDTIRSIAPVVVVAGIISAYVSSKSTHPNPIIRAADQFARDVLNFLALNILKAKNNDDDRPTT
jgi:hypothetical protein